MLLSVKTNILDYLRGVFLNDKDAWVSGREIETAARFKQLRPSTVGRRCRELAEDGFIKPLYMPRGKTGKRKLVWYRYIEPKKSTVWKEKTTK